MAHDHAHSHDGHSHDGHSHDGHAHAHAGHSHGPGHVHAPADFGRAFAIGIALNILFVAAEAIAGLTTGSMALLADAGHNLSDVIGLLVAWGGATLAKRPPSKRFTYGLRGSTILAAMINALLLLIAIGAIALEAVQRFAHPQPVPGATVMLIAGIGIVVNGGTAMLFMSGRHGDLNIRGAYLHMAADAAVSAGVVIAGAAILLTGAAWIDPLVSVAICFVIFWGTWGLLRDSVTMSLAGVPGEIDRDKVEIELLISPGVTKVHDLHIWPMSTTEVALTAHIVIPRDHPGDAFLDEVRQRLNSKFGIHHVTIQIETGQHNDCQETRCA
ncbi:cation diffusion facilitator family transporter [Sphingomonas colocasiae]|uniref:Cation diffusion facilitator family transporter n=1 Tax=Sphingomonas colocasiae TaxID=1848973 RepID=A0ABS7PU04_9SPHN|nr:cation diffusion facilitator family transporter [Sphingomonas colocasiae]MBY8824840.1 cation diffusion facilitator family transporter [Sphingomonas colocasiae]